MNGFEYNTTFFMWWKVFIEYLITFFKWQKSLKEYHTTLFLYITAVSRNNGNR